MMIPHSPLQATWPVAAPAYDHQPTFIAGLSAATVLQALIHAPIMMGRVNWAPIELHVAQKLLKDSSRGDINRWGHHLLRLHFRGLLLFANTYDLQFKDMTSAQVVERLRRGEDFSFHRNRPIIPPRLRAMAPEYVPCGMRQRPEPETVVTSPISQAFMLSPAAMEAPQYHARRSFYLPSKEHLQHVLTPLEPNRWFQRTLLPKLILGGGKLMTADLFASFFISCIGDTSDSALPQKLVAKLLDHDNNFIIDVMVPDASARQQVSSYLRAVQALEDELFSKENVGKLP